MNQRAKYQQIGQILKTAVLLEEMARECIFVGGAATGLLLTDPAIPDVRPTVDIDIIVELATRKDYYLFAERLRNKGFREDIDAEVICRWKRDTITLDVMPTSPDILGFANRWYADAVRHALDMQRENTSIRVVSAPYFIATKLEAFHGRGAGDYMASHDMEDCIALIDGRHEAVAEVRDADQNVQSYISDEMVKLLDNDDFLEALPGYLPGDIASQQRIPYIRQRMRDMAGIR